MTSSDRAAGKESAAPAAWNLLSLMRPAHWLKNGFVLAPLIFSRSFENQGSVRAAALAFVVFCAAASAIYVWNDLHDAPHDRNHPRKRRRAIASGEVSMRGGIALLVVLVLATAAGLFALPAVALHVVALFALNAAYTLSLKHVPWLDLMVLSAGFYLRVDAGARAIGVELSMWMLSATLCLAFFMAALKRYTELRLNGESGRPMLAGYDAEHLRKAALLAGVAAVACYALFTGLARQSLLPTLIPVLVGMARYYYVAVHRGGFDSPLQLIARDWMILAATLAWGVSSIALLA